MNKLQTLRKQSGMKQKEVAAALGVSRAALWYYETGGRKLSLDMAAKLAGLYGVSVDELAKGGGV